jgi:hypothetical protein
MQTNLQMQNLTGPWTPDQVRGDGLLIVSFTKAKLDECKVIMHSALSLNNNAPPIVVKHIKRHAKHSGKRLCGERVPC